MQLRAVQRDSTLPTEIMANTLPPLQKCKSQNRLPAFVLPAHHSIYVGS